MIDVVNIAANILPTLATLVVDVVQGLLSAMPDADRFAWAAANPGHVEVVEALADAAGCTLYEDVSIGCD